MEITYKTKLGEIVKSEDIINNYFTPRVKNVKKNINDRIEILELEMTVGGLARESLIFGTSSPLYDKSKLVLDTYRNEIIQRLDNLKTEINTSTTKKREEELTELKNAVNSRILTLNKLIENSESLAISDRYWQENNFVSQYIMEKKELQAKLEDIETELGTIEKKSGGV